MSEAVQEKRKILVVDDEPMVRDSLRLLLKEIYDVSIAPSGEEALNIFDDFNPDLVLLDVMMPGMNGLETLKALRERNKLLSVVMLTASNTVKSAVQAMKSGATDYLNKPFEVEELLAVISGTLGRIAPKDEERTRKRDITIPDADFGKMVGKSEGMQEMFKKISQLAEKDTTVLITGESGTGKELVAKRIHDMSSRKSNPFVAINCAAIPESLIESELFGHEKGAFTHAVERRIGHFELADKGTLFLDEIGELSLNVQVKMLRFLQEQEFYRVGRSKPIRVDVRIIAATNKNLEDLIREKKFRQDLYYRINVINLKIPPLRDRFDDIPRMVAHFIDKYSSMYGGRKLKFTPEAMEVLVSYEWPGNARELENTIESLLALCPNDEVQEQDLPRKLKNRLSLASQEHPVAQGNANFEQAERAFESEMILKALKKTNYVQTKAAELLGISRRILKYKMDKLGISDKISDSSEN